MKERPILMNGEMVRATLDGRKTQTRRVVKNIPCECGEWVPHEMSATTPEGWQTVGHSGRWWCECCTSECLSVYCPYGKPGDRLWVRETFCEVSSGQGKIKTYYKATDEIVKPMKWTPSIHMPRRASRILIEIVSVRVERLQDISEEDAKAEGCQGFDGRTYQDPGGESLMPSEQFAQLWESINGPGSWEKNEWVWVIEFKRVKQ